LSEDFPTLAGFRAGSLLAGYRLEAQVGAGGMAIVFRARDQRLGRLVALKILAPTLTADTEFRRRFIAESRAAAAVDDPHIIPVYEAGEADGVLFIAMRFVMGGDLRGVLDREGALAPTRAAEFVSPVASALDAAHAAGLVHRDVKPANILVDARPGRPDHVYLSDFGVSKGAVSSVSLTGTGHFLGTPDYSAPEQIQGQAVDGRTDQYALACVAYQLLAGAVPYERDQGMAVLLAHLSTPPPSLGSRRPGLPDAADRVLARAMAKVPEERYQSCREFADALRQALGLAPYYPGDPALAANHPQAQIASPPAVFPRPAADPLPPVTTTAPVPPDDGEQRTTPPPRDDHPRTATVRPGPGDGIRRSRKGRLWTAAAILAAAAVTVVTVLVVTSAPPPSLAGQQSSQAAASNHSASSAGTSTVTNWATATSAAAGGGMNALIAAAEKEGQLNVIALPSNWVNYGTIISDFEAEYGIKITDANPDGSSQDELNAVNQLKGQSDAPDVLDVGTSLGVEADQEGILAPYKVETWSDIPAAAKASDATWYADYGGYVAIGYDSATVKTPPTSFADLLKPIYKNEVAITGNPTLASAAFSAVYAAALANGGSLNNIAPGIAYFKTLRSEGNFVPVTATAATMVSGQTPIVIWWDYLLAAEIGPSVPGLKIVIPSDASFAVYYDQAISKYAPHPAAARLWEEYLYSIMGQNLWLEGEARPIELPTLVADGTVNQAAYKAIPPIPPGNVTFPTQQQQVTAENVVAQQWSSVTG